MNIGERIKKLRREQGLKQSELAEKSGISRVAIGNYERGDRQPNVETLNKIAEALDIDISFLIKERKIVGERLKMLMTRNSLTTSTLSINTKIPENKIVNILENEEILSKQNINILERISDYFQVDDSFLLGETNFMHFEGETIQEFKDLILDEIEICRNDKIRFLSTQILELVQLTIHHSITGNKEKELDFLFNFYNIIHSLQNTLENDADIKCYGKLNDFDERKPLSVNEIIEFRNNIKSKINILIDDFTNYFLNLEEWKDDFFYDFEAHKKIFDSISIKNENELDANKLL